MVRCGGCHVRGVGSPKRTIGMIVGLGPGNGPRPARAASLVVGCVPAWAVLAVLFGEGEMLSHKGGAGMELLCGGKREETYLKTRKKQVLGLLSRAGERRRWLHITLCLWD